MIKIFIELINNFLSDGIYRTGLDRRREKILPGLCNGLFAFLVKCLLAPESPLEEPDQARTRLALEGSNRNDASGLRTPSHISSRTIFHFVCITVILSML